MNNKRRRMNKKQVIILTGAVIGSTIIGYKIGGRMTRYFVGIGLEEVFKKNPELKVELWKTLGELI